MLQAFFVQGDATLHLVAVPFLEDEFGLHARIFCKQLIQLLTMSYNLRHLPLPRELLSEPPN